MTALDYILDGLEAELALERELGVRFVECDRGMLSGTPTPPPPPPPPPLSTSIHPFVFLHDQPLSAAGTEMMAKIVGAMGETLKTAPIVWEKPIPRAKVYVILGGRALKKFQPNQKGVPGMWVTTEKGVEMLVTYSPEYILRFKEVTPAVRKIKSDMWQSLKGVLQRIKD